jgi:hypothetical protein
MTLEYNPPGPVGCFQIESMLRLPDSFKGTLGFLIELQGTELNSLSIPDNSQPEETYLGLKIA